MNFLAFAPSLDYVWRILVATSSIYFVTQIAVWAIDRAFRTSDAIGVRRLWKFSNLFVLLAIVLCARWAITATDSISCFQIFAEKNPSLLLTRALSLTWLGIALSFIAADIWRFCTFRLDSETYYQAPAKRAETELLNQMCVDAGISRPVKLLLSRETVDQTAMGPMTFGTLKPKIVIPETLHQADELQAIFAHEISHIVHCDAAWNILDTLVSRLFFFVPIRRLILRAQRLTTELAADRRALMNFQISVRDYATTLINVADRFRSDHSAPLGAAMASLGFRDLKLRLETICQSPKPTRHWWVTNFLALVCAVLGLWTVTQARAAMRAQDEPMNAIAPICPQVDHERLIEKLFKVAPDPKRCE